MGSGVSTTKVNKRPVITSSRPAKKTEKDKVKMFMGHNKKIAQIATRKKKASAKHMQHGGQSGTGCRKRVSNL